MNLDFFKDSNDRLIKIIGSLTLPFSLFFLLALKLINFSVYIFTINNRFYGHMALDTELRIREANGRFIIATFRNKVSVNTALEEIIRQEIYIFPRAIVIPLTAVLERLPRSLAEWLGYVSWSPHREFGRQPLLATGERRLVLTPSQQKRGSRILDLHGLKQKKYFCIAVRDKLYHADLPGQDNENYRNLDFDLFSPMIQSLSEQKKIVRLGRSNKKIPQVINLIDYSTSDHVDDLSDLILLEQSLGLISTGNGVAAVAAVLDVPCLYLSHFPWEILQTYSKKNWIVPAIFKSNLTGKIVHPSIYLSSDRVPLSYDFYPSRNLERLPPTPQEITEYCLEFFSAMDSCEGRAENYQLSINHDRKNKNFWEQFQLSMPLYAQSFHTQINAIVPESFLNRYRLFDIEPILKSEQLTKTVSGKNR